MKHLLILLFVGLAICGNAQHHIHVLFTDTTQVEIDYGSNVVDPSCVMYEGTIDRDTIRFKKIESSTDGEIVMVAKQLNASDDLFLSLVNNDNEEMYSIRIVDGSYYVQDNLKNIYHGTYVPNSEFKIVRCGGYILYYYQNELIDFTALENNAFTMDGRVQTHKVNSSKAELSFHSL